MQPVIICESRGMMAEDALEMKNIYQNLKGGIQMCIRDSISTAEKSISEPKTLLQQMVSGDSAKISSVKKATFSLKNFKANLYVKNIIKADSKTLNNFPTRKLVPKR